MNFVLIDIYVFIWLVEDDFNLFVMIKDILENMDNVFVSIVSFWEIFIKLKIGKFFFCGDFNSIEVSF